MGRAFEYRKARKMARWSQMAKTFTKIGRQIMIATREGGPDPESNYKLRIAIQNAKEANMPKANVDSAIKKAMAKDAANLDEITYEGYAPHGVALIIETATDNPVRTVAHVRAIFNKNGGSLGTNGSVDYMFDRKAFFTISPEGQDLEELELDLIEYGLEEMEENDGQVMLQTDFEDFGKMQSALEERNIEIISADLMRIAQTTVDVSGDAREEVDVIIEKLEDDDDVQNVFHNMSDN